MSRRKYSILNALFRLPWWLSLFLAFTAYVSLKYIIPAVQTENTLLVSLGRTGPYFAPFVALIFMLPAPFSLFKDKEENEKSDEKLKAVMTDIEDDGPDFGLCIKCGEAIPGERIMLSPKSRMCVQCAEKHE